MSRPVGSGGDLHRRKAEWSIVRRTATLGDIVDEPTFAKMLGIRVKLFRHYRHQKDPYGVEFPEPIVRPEARKPVWLRSEAEDFERSFRGARNAKRKR